MEIIKQLMNEARSVLQEMTSTQKASVMTLVLTVAVSLAMVMWVGSGTDEKGMVPLPRKIDPGQAKEFKDRLEANGITPVEFRDDYKLWVPMDLSRKAVLFLAQENLLPKDEGDGFQETIRAWHFADTREKSQEAMRAARAVEMKLLIESIDDVKDAKVVYSDEGANSLFRPQMRPSASVRVVMKLGKSLNPEMANTIIALVAASKAGLEEKYVVVTDQSGKQFSARAPDDMNYVAAKKWEMERKLNDDLKDKLENLLLSSVPNIEFGGGVDAFVFHTVDFDKVEVETLDFREGQITRERTEKREMSNTKHPGNQVGTGPNVDRAANVNAAGGGTVEETKESRKLAERSFQPGHRKELRTVAPTVIDKSVSALIHLPYQYQRDADGKIIPEKTADGKEVIDPVTGQVKGIRESTQAFSAAEQDKLKTLIARAAGIKTADIADKIDLSFVPWQPRTEPDPLPPPASTKLFNMINEKFVPIIMAVVLFGAVYFIYAQAKRSIASEEIVIPGEEDLSASLLPSVSEADQNQASFEAVRNKISDAVAEDPRKAANLVRRWMSRESY
jgi:flagellar M-ring protein FliF